MNIFPGDSDNESPGVGRGCSKPRQVLEENTLISERAKLAVQPTKDNLENGTAERAKLLKEKLKSNRRSNPRPRHQVLELLRATNKNKKESSEENNDSGINSSVYQGSIFPPQGSPSPSQTSLPPSDETVSLASQSLSGSPRQKTSDSDVAKPTSVASRRKKNNVVLDQFGGISNPQFGVISNPQFGVISNPLISPASTPKYRSQTSGSNSPAGHSNQNGSSSDFNELHNMNSFFKSSSSSSGEMRLTQRNQSVNERDALSKRSLQPEEDNFSEKNYGSRFPAQNKENNVPVQNTENNSSEQKLPLVTRAFMDPSHPLFVPPDFSIPPPTIKKLDTSFSQKMSKGPSPNYQPSKFSQSEQVRAFPQNSQFKSLKQPSFNNLTPQNNSRASSKEPSSNDEIPSYFSGYSEDPPSSNQIPSFFREASKEHSPNIEAYTHGYYGFREASKVHSPNIQGSKILDVSSEEVAPRNQVFSNSRVPQKDQIPSYFGGPITASGDFTKPPPRDFAEPPPNNHLGSFTEPPPNNQIPSFFLGNAQQQPPPKHSDDSGDIPAFFQPEKSRNKESPAPAPILSKFLSRSTGSKNYTPGDGLQAVSRLCDYKLPLRHKLSGLRRLWGASDVFSSQLAIQILNPDSGNIVQGIRKMIEYHRQKPEDENCREALILSLKVLNKCLDFAGNDTSVKSFINGLVRSFSSDKGEVTSLTFLQQLLKLCDPRGGKFSEEYTDRLCRELLEINAVDTPILGLSEMSLDKPESIVDAFKECSGISLGISECSLVKNAPEQYRIVSLFLLNEELQTEESLSQILLNDDSTKVPRSVWGVNHPTKLSKGKIGQAVMNHVQELVFVTLFPTGHFFAYMDEICKIEEKLKEIDRLLNLPPHCNQSVQEIRPGIMVCVKWDSFTKRSRQPFREFKMARALIMEILEDKVSVYLLDFGITGEVLTESLTPPPKDLIPIPPRITFCRLQGVGPAPKTELLRECILAISRLSTNSSVVSLVNRPSLEAGRILSQLVGSGEEVIQVAALTTLATVAGTPLANKWLVRSTGEANPCARELVCPAVVSYLGCQGNIPRKCVLMCLEILEKLLDQLHSEHMEFVYENTEILEVLHSLKHKKEIMSTHEKVITVLIEMPRKGNHYDPDIHINSLKRREIATKQQRNKYVPGSKPAVAGGELARIVGGQRKEEMQPLIFQNSDIRERQVTPRRESEERVEGPINPYNPHKVVTASGGAVWANVDDISGQRTSQILNDTTFEEGLDNEKLKEIKEARSKHDFSSDEEAQPEKASSPRTESVQMGEREVSSSRRITSAATAEDNLPPLTKGHILTEKHGATVELMPVLKRDIWKSQLSVLICGMLNSFRGGSIFIGVNQNRRILGILFSRQDRDQFRQQVDRILASMLNPRVPPNTVDIDFHRAEDKTKPNEESYVIRIRVLGRSSVADNKVYMAHNLIGSSGVQEGMYLRGVKGNNDKLNQKEILGELEKQIEKMNNSKKIDKLSTQIGNLAT